MTRFYSDTNEIFVNLYVSEIQATERSTIHFYFNASTWSFLGVKLPGRGADNPHPFKCRSQERVGLYLFSSSGPSWTVMGAPLPLTSE